MSRIPGENISDMEDKQREEIAMKLLILGANTMVIGVLVGKRVQCIYKN